MKTVLVLGAQGVLGRFTARALQATGHRVLRGGRREESAAYFRLVDLDRPDSTVQSTTLLAQAVLDLGTTLPAGLHGVEDLFRLQDLRAGLEADRLYIRPLAS